MASLLSTFLTPKSTQRYRKGKRAHQEAFFSCSSLDPAQPGWLQTMVRGSPSLRWPAAWAWPGSGSSGWAGLLEESWESRLLPKGSSLLYYCTGTVKTVSDTNAGREKLIHTLLFYKSCRPLNGSWFIHHGYLQMHSSDMFSNHITERARKEAWKKTSQVDHITCVSKGLRHERNQKAASGKFYFLFF